MVDFTPQNLPNLPCNLPIKKTYDYLVLHLHIKADSVKLTETEKSTIVWKSC